MLFGGCSIRSKVNKNEHTFIVQIKEGNGSPIGHTYTIQPYHIKVEKCNYIRTECSKRKTIYYRKISKEVADSIRFFLSKNISHIDTLYEVAMLGGLFWEIECSVPYSKSIRVENTYVPKVDELFTMINRLIKKQNIKIPLTDFFSH